MKLMELIWDIEVVENIFALFLSIRPARFLNGGEDYSRLLTSRNERPVYRRIPTIGTILTPGFQALETLCQTFAGTREEILVFKRPQYQ
jgi:hypothetical protein